MQIKAASIVEPGELMGTIPMLAPLVYCGGFQGVFTKDNIAELTHAAGVEESLRA